ncbi:MAG TPA: DsrE/DsrF/DrsH-like family protein [Nitrososphaerales archaeon]|nr:DsrE/DsrF/DrsH-like family protein [Nitrososphaerales archaeon]
MTLVAQQSRQAEADKRANRLVLVVTKDTIDQVYPPLILAATAAASGLEVDIYFTFWGLKLLDRKSHTKTKMAPVGNPALPMPNIIGVLPGMTALATRMMKGKIKKYWPTIPEMMRQAKDMGVRFHACSPTMGLMGMEEKDLVPLTDDIVGASTFLDWATSPGTATIFV